MELKLNTLTKTYGNKKAVDSVTVNLTPGVYGLLGPNGAGKTTLMHMLCGLMKPTVGTVYFDGTEISVLKEQYRNTLGFLPQNFGYYPDFSVKRFLSYLAYLKGLDRGAATDSIRAVLETTGLTDLADSKIVQLSGGMRQRVGIAQALLNNPDILILDEPTVGLDPAERVRFRNLISSVSCGKITILPASIQLINRKSPYNLSIGGALGLWLLFGLLASVAAAATTMLFSAVANNAFTAFIPAVLAYILPSFSYSGLSPLIHRCMKLLLSAVIGNIDTLFGAADYYNIFGLLVERKILIIVCSVVFAVLFSYLSVWLYRRMEPQR